MQQQRINSKDYYAGFSLLTFIFLLVLILNAIIIGDLFLSILDSPLTLVSLRVLIMLTALAFLAANGARHPEIKGRGWYFILSGLSLILLESLLDLALSYISIHGHSFQINQSLSRIIKEIICRLLGFFCLAYGFFLWIPYIIEARRKAEQTAAMLEEQVAMRTRSLAESNERLRSSTIKLEEAAKLKNEFIASFSHELKTPLSSILGFCRLLRDQRQGSLTEKQLKSIDIIDSNSKSLLERINVILDFASLEFEKVNPEYAPVNITELLKETASIFEPLLEKTEVRLSVESQGSMDSVVTDRKIITRILTAVLDNAVKFTSKGTISLNTGIDQDDKTWWVSVSDSGEGIRGEELPHIFEAFRQADGSYSKSHGGTGLGLTIAKKLCRLLNGEIDARSTVGEGSCFTFSFPLTPGLSEKPVDTSGENLANNV